MKFPPAIGHRRGDVIEEDARMSERGCHFAIGAELSAISRRKRSGSASRRSYCTATMKSLILKNWRAKLISVLLATTVWYLIKKNVATTPSPSETSSDVTAAQKR